MKKLITVDLFSGAGGFSLAALNTGFSVRGALELDKHAARTYEENINGRLGNDVIVLNENIRDLSPESFLQKLSLKPGECDLLLGGPPCQGFSAHRINGAGIDDPRNDLLLRYFEYLKVLKPRIFIVENVSGILWPRHKNYLDIFLEKSKKAGYTVIEPTLLNARDFGVPQNRKRVFIVGIRSDLPPLMNWPPAQTHVDPDDYQERGLPPWQTASTVFRRIDDGDKNNLHMKSGKKLEEVFASTPKNGGSRKDSIRKLSCHEKHDGHKDVYGRIDPKKPGPTMTTACINPSKGRFVHPIANRGITLRHAARFQSFPDDFVFTGGLIAGGVQVGNAVPVKLGEAVLATIFGHLKKNS